MFTEQRSVYTALRTSFENVKRLKTMFKNSARKRKTFEYSAQKLKMLEMVFRDSVRKTSILSYGVISVKLYGTWLSEKQIEWPFAFRN